MQRRSEPGWLSGSSFQTTPPSGQQRRPALQPEQAAPAGDRQQPAADQRREQGRHRQDQQHLGEDACRLFGRETDRAHRRAPARCRRSRPPPRQSGRRPGSAGPCARAQAGRAQHIETPARPGSASGGRNGRTSGPTIAWPRHSPRKKAASECSIAAMEAVEFARDGGQRRHVQVDGDGGEDRQQPEQGNQFDAP